MLDVSSPNLESQGREYKAYETRLIAHNLMSERMKLRFAELMRDETFERCYIPLGV